MVSGEWVGNGRDRSKERVTRTRDTGLEIAVLRLEGVLAVGRVLKSFEARTVNTYSTLHRRRHSGQIYQPAI